MWELQTRNHFTYLSPFGRLRIVGLITTMWIPRNDRSVFLDKISFRVCGSQCRGYVRAVRGTSGSPRHFQQAEVEVRRETLDFNSSLQILCIFTLRRIYGWNSSRYIERLTLRFVTLGTSPTTSSSAPTVYFVLNAGGSLSIPTSSSGMVTLLFSMKSYSKSSTSLEKESVKMPQRTSDSCKFCRCWDEPARTKFNIVYEVSRTQNTLTSINETVNLRMTHS